MVASEAEGFIFSVAFSNYPDIAPLVRFLTGPMHDVLGDKYLNDQGEPKKTFHSKKRFFYLK